MYQETYQDELFLKLRRKYRQEQSDVLAKEQQGFQEMLLYDGLCTIMLPAYVHDMELRKRFAKYRSLSRPYLVITDSDADATFTFSHAGQAAEAQEPEQRIKMLRTDMKKVWKQIVFYDMGMVMAGDISVPWMDCKTFCLDGSLYCLLFLFEIQGQMILGNFHCSFPQYDRWKPIVLRVLATIKEGGYDERLSD